MQKSSDFGKFATYTLTLLVVLAATLAAARAAEVFFSPEGGARARLVQAIRESRQSIDVAVYHTTSIELADALAGAHTRGVRIRILTDREKLNEPVRAAQILRRSGISIRALGVPTSSLMHNKSAVFDDRLVATGSLFPEKWFLSDFAFSRKARFDKSSLFVLGLLDSISPAGDSEQRGRSRRRAGAVYRSRNPVVIAPGYVFLLNVPATPGGKPSWMLRSRMSPYGGVIRPKARLTMIRIPMGTGWRGKLPS